MSVIKAFRKELNKGSAHVVEMSIVTDIKMRYCRTEALLRQGARSREAALDRLADERTEKAVIGYIAAARPVQERISQTLTQVAGFALLVMTSRHRAPLAEGSLAGAREEAARVAESVRALAVPGPAAHHYHHLRGAADMLGQSCAAALACTGARASQAERATLTRALREASDHLRATARLLPGFELVDFGQACCAVHARQPLSREVT